MRRALRWASLAAAVLVLATLAAGFATRRAGAGAMPDVHAGLALAAVAASCLVAAKLFLLGLHGLLETGGRRVPALLLFVLGPTLMGLALVAGLTGLARRAAELPDPLLAEKHRRQGIGTAAAAVLAAAGAWALARRRDDDAA